MAGAIFTDGWSADENSSAMATVTATSLAISTGIPLGGPEFMRLYPLLAWPYIIIAAVLTVLGTTGNLLVLMAVVVNRQLRHSRNAFLVNLAISDFCVSVFPDPLSIIGVTHGKEFFDRFSVFCTLIGALCTMFCVVSLLSIAAVSLNRFCHIIYPQLFETIFSLRNNIIMCISFWLVGTGMALVVHAGWSYFHFDPKFLECIWSRQYSYSYSVFTAFNLVVLPSLILSVSYLKIFMHVRASKRRVAQDTKGTNEAQGNKSSESKLTRSLLIIFFVFIICWTPYSLLLVVDYDYKFPLWVDLYVLLLAHVHSSINPIIYGFTNKHFRQGYLMVFERCGSSCARPESVRDTSTKVSSLTEGNSSMATDNVKADTSVKPDDSANA